MYELVKVYKSYELPGDIKGIVCDMGAERVLANDSYINWYLENLEHPLTQWLLQNGCNEEDEKVLILISW